MADANVGGGTPSQCSQSELLRNRKAAMWIGAASRGALLYRYADPHDPLLETFHSGDSSFAREVDRYFRRLSWVRGGSPTTVLQFGFHATPLVGLAALRLSDRELILLVLGVSHEWHGRRLQDTEGPRVIDCMLDTIAVVGRSNAAERLGLRVRAANTRAIKAYERNGFRVRHSPEGPGGTTTIEMQRRI